MVNNGNAQQSCVSTILKWDQFYSCTVIVLIVFCMVNADRPRPKLSPTAKTHHDYELEYYEEQIRHGGRRQR